VQQRCAPSFNGANLFSQACEVRGKNRGSNFDQVRHDFSAGILSESRFAVRALHDPGTPFS
jgi:hypothetical protein